MGISSSSKALKKNSELQLTTEKLGRFSRILTNHNPPFLWTWGEMEQEDHSGVGIPSLLLSFPSRENSQTVRWKDLRQKSHDHVSESGSTAQLCISCLYLPLRYGF